MPTDEEDWQVSFVCAKTKVAPIKKLSIPRLELQAAHLLARLLIKVESVLSNVTVRKIAFSDSTTVLNWITKPSETWKQFVANRVRDIQQTIPAVNWHYINTRENPVDLATRGLSASTFQNKPIWLNGPAII